MSIEKFVEDRIEKAIAQGEFDDLPGAGKPLDLDWYFQLPAELRLTYSVLRQANVLPDEVQLLKDIAELKNKLASADDEQRQAITEAISEKTLSFNLLAERLRKGTRNP